MQHLYAALSYDPYMQHLYAALAYGSYMQRLYAALAYGSYMQRLYAVVADAFVERHLDSLPQLRKRLLYSVHLLDRLHLQHQHN